MELNVDDQTLYDMDYGACIDAVASRCTTLVGARCAAETMLHPLRNPKTIMARAQDVRRMMRAIGGASSGLEAAVNAAAEDEESALVCVLDVASMPEDTREALSEPYFRFSPRACSAALNACWPVLWYCGVYSAYLAPLLAAAAPLAYALAPFAMLRWRLGLNISPITYIRIMYHAAMGTDSTLRFAIGSTMASVVQAASAAATCLVYAQAVMSTLRTSARVRAVSHRIAAATAAAERFRAAAADAAEAAVAACGQGFFSRWISPHHLDGVLRAELRDKAPPPAPGAPPPLWSKDAAQLLARHASLDRPALRASALRLAAVDLVAGLARALIDPDSRMCQPTLVAGPDAPVLRIRDAWWPGAALVQPPVANDVALASAQGSRGILLTGANATGKSTVLRTIGCAVLLAQSVTLVPARSAAMTPLSYLCTMMRVRDAPELGVSRFQAELLRAGMCMDNARRFAETPGGGLVLLDEVFAGSSDADSSDACGVRVLDVIANTPRSLVVLATHQAGLADWAEAAGFLARRMTLSGFRMLPGRNRDSNADEQMRRLAGSTPSPVHVSSAPSFF
jgi:hypothetical protein